MSDQELLDLLDGAGAATGRRCMRKTAHRLGLWHRTVHVWLLNRNGELLIQLRAHDKESYPGLWDISAAGHCCSGDTSIGAALREIKEELGISADSSKLYYLFSVTQQNCLHNSTYIDNEYCDVYLLKQEISVDRIDPDSCEVAQVRYIHWIDLEKVYCGPQFVRHDEEYRRLFDFLKAERADLTG